MSVKIVGHGWVGKAMKTLFPEAMVHDPLQGYEANEKADVAFICVPTPLLNGKLDCSIVEQAIKESQEDLIIVRSTVNPGFCDSMVVKYQKNIVFQPEFLGETAAHPMSNQHVRQWIILGGSPVNTRKAIELYQKVYNSNISIHQTTLYKAEVMKLAENRAIGFKVMQMHELYEICEKAGIDYYEIVQAVYGLDPRFDLWFTFIYKGNLGFNSSKCLKKDIPAFCAWAESLGYNPEITKVLVEKSNDYETKNV